jgi:hypothetical protein
MNRSDHKTSGHPDADGDVDMPDGGGGAGGGGGGEGAAKGKVAAKAKARVNVPKTSAKSTAGADVSAAGRLAAPPSVASARMEAIRKLPANLQGAYLSAAFDSDPVPATRAAYAGSGGGGGGSGGVCFCDSRRRVGRGEPTVSRA